MPPSGSIILTVPLTLAGLAVLIWLLARLWKRPRWGAYGFGVVVLLAWVLVSLVAASAMYAAGASPVFYALMALGGWGMMALPAYAVGGLILLVARKAATRRASA